MGKRKKEDDTFLSKRKTEETGDIGRWKRDSFSSEVETTRYHLNKEIKSFVGHLMLIIMKKLFM